jgi:hypothetical protein
MGEACPLGSVHQIQELIRTHVNQLFMIAGLEIDVAAGSGSEDRSLSFACEKHAGGSH